MKVRSSMMNIENEQRENLEVQWSFFISDFSMSRSTCPNSNDYRESKKSNNQRLCHHLFLLIVYLRPWLDYQLEAKYEGNVRSIWKLSISLSLFSLDVHIT